MWGEKWGKALYGDLGHQRSRLQLGQRGVPEGLALVGRTTRHPLQARPSTLATGLPAKRPLSEA